MNILVHSLVDNLLKNNNIFGSNGKYYKDSADFRNNGVNDNLGPAFYIRPLGLNPLKHKVQNSQPIKQIRTSYRAVFQLPGNIDCVDAMSKLVNQVMLNEDVFVTSYSDDSLGIYAAEYGADKQPTALSLISIDFEINEEMMPAYCGCLTINLCQ